MTDDQSHKSLPSDLLLLVILVLGDGLLLTPAGSPLRVTGALILFLLPGLAWASRLFPTLDPLTRWTLGAGLSYTLAMVLGLILHYLPGPLPLWAELTALNALVLISGLAAGGRQSASRRHSAELNRWLLIVLLLAAIFRLVSLGYSEFQGDEALAMITAAEALEGHQDALYLRGKGPGEVLLPMALWRLTGTINEAVARLPFAIAGLLMVLTVYLLGRRLFHSRTGLSKGLGKERRHLGEQAGLIAAGILALNGFLVGFSRIVQYQSLVVWMSGLAFLCAWEWRASEDRQAPRWAGLAGAFLATGLLAHYDAILVAPALGYLSVSAIKSTNQQTRGSANLQSLASRFLIAAGALLIIAGLFYLPYLLDPQATRTGAYLGDRIGDTLFKNNLRSFLHFNIFYSSSYYVMFTGLLVMGFVAWALRHTPGIQSIPGGRYWVPLLAAIAILGLMLHPNTLRVADLDLAALPFTLVLLGALLSSALDAGQRAVLAWLTVPFLGYNFAVALPLTHIYTIVPAWTLLAGLAGAQLWGLIQSRVFKEYANVDGKSQSVALHFLLLAACYLLPATLFSGYLYTAYLRHDVEFWQDWPNSQPSLYWSPYQELPPAGFFGFAHRAGWKEAGALYAQGTLRGDYGSNEEPEVTSWYTRGAPRACDPQPEYYFIADDLVDPWPLDPDTIEASYTSIGQVVLPNKKGLAIYQAQPSTVELGHLPAGTLGPLFDRTATPAAFARSARGSHPADANMAGQVRLVGYDLDTRRAWAGGRVSVTLYWQAQASLSEDYHVFVHLEALEEAGIAPGIWGQANGRPVCWTYPTFDWRPGQIIADQHAIAVKPDTPTGDYPILIGIYQPDTGARLDVLDEGGKPVANFVKLATVSIR